MARYRMMGPSTSAVEQGWGGGDDRAEIDRRATRQAMTYNTDGDQVYSGDFDASKDTHIGGTGIHSHGKYGSHAHFGDANHADAVRRDIADDLGERGSGDTYRFSEHAVWMQERVDRQPEVRDLDAGNRLRKQVDRMALSEYGRPLYAIPPDQRQAVQQQLLVRAYEQQGRQRQRDVRPGRLVASADYDDEVEHAAARIALSEYGRLELTGPEMLDTYRRAHRMVERRNGGAR